MMLNSLVVGLLSGVVYSFLAFMPEGMTAAGLITLPMGLTMSSRVVSKFLIRYALLIAFLYWSVRTYQLDVWSWGCGFLIAYWGSIFAKIKGEGTP